MRTVRLLAAGATFALAPNSASAGLPANATIGTVAGALADRSVPADAVRIDGTGKYGIPTPRSLPKAYDW